MNNSRGFSRRNFLAASAALLAFGKGREVQSSDRYSGPYLMTIHAGGGWDLSLFCDPKTNMPDQLPITNWSETSDIETEGSISFAPVANNRELFGAIGADALIINGVDTQTNAHSTGQRHTWTGAPSEGRPTLGALFAAARAPDAPLSLINFGSFGADQGLVRTTRIAAGGLKELITPRDDQEASLLARYKRRGYDLEAARAQDDSALAGRLTDYQSMMLARGLLYDFYHRLPDEMPQPDAVTGGVSSLKAQILTGLIAFSAGTTASAECGPGGDWDTHGLGESAQINNFRALNEALIFLRGAALELGIFDQVVVIVSSDFGRTPYYNSFGGKDHWPINSYLLMQGNQDWGGRVVGKTDPLQNAMAIDPNTLQVSSSASLTYPKHVHNALHHYLGIADFAAEAGYGFAQTSLYDFFNPQLMT